MRLGHGIIREPEVSEVSVGIMRTGPARAAAPIERREENSINVELCVISHDDVCNINFSMVVHPQFNVTLLSG